MNKKSTKRLLALMLAAITLVLLAAPALASTRVYATTALNVRSGPGTKYSILGYLNVNQVVTKLGTSG
ncbi:MAG TPA: SH3 domain-containing protein, partial [Clostridia bacterium]|nr:SH3 domain-containing protein [Clostridia bacterium]